MGALFRPIQIAVLIVAFIGCSTPEPGPDKTVAGAVLGAGWGAGAGAVIGNQVRPSEPGGGAAIGAGFGLVHGAVSGAGYDLLESEQLQQERELASLKVQNVANRRQLSKLQGRLDSQIAHSAGGGVYQVFFDTDSTSLRTGAIANLEVISNSLRRDPRAKSIFVIGHSDDAGSPEYNSRLAEARARAVSSYLAASGISVDQIEVSSHGSKRPIASNSTEVGRQLNRRVDIYLSR